jgi:hypothetical protein
MMRDPYRYFRHIINRFTAKGVLPNVYQIHRSRLILVGNRPEGLKGNVIAEEEECIV